MGRPVGIILSGYFSPLHVGHLDMIEAAASGADKLIVIVNNNYQQELKKGKVIIDEQDRLRVTKALRWVDEAFIAVDQTRSVSDSLRLVAEKHPHYDLIFANGGDRVDGSVVPESGVCEEYGIKMVFDMGGNEKADSSTRINMELGLEDKPSALPSSNS